MINTDGLEFIILTGAGAIIGMGVSLLIAIIALFFPVLWPYVGGPIVIGAIVGFVSAYFVR